MENQKVPKMYRIKYRRRPYWELVSVHRGGLHHRSGYNRNRENFYIRRTAFRSEIQVPKAVRVFKFSSILIFHFFSLQDVSFSSLRPPWPRRQVFPLNHSHVYKQKKNITAFGVAAFSRHSPQNLHMYKPVFFSELTHRAH